MNYRIIKAHDLDTLIKEVNASKGQPVGAPFIKNGRFYQAVIDERRPKRWRFFN